MYGPEPVVLDFVPQLSSRSVTFSDRYLWYHGSSYFVGIPWAAAVLTYNVCLTVHVARVGVVSLQTPYCGCMFGKARDLWLQCSDTLDVSVLAPNGCV